MKQLFTLLFAILLFIGCQEKQPPVVFKKYDETEALAKQQDHENGRMKFKLFQSKYLDMNEVFAPFNDDLAYFSEEDYNALKPLIIEKDISSIQNSVRAGDLSYEKLTLFYLYRIRKFESDSTKSLNAIIALNPNVLKEARQRDKEREWGAMSDMEVYGMPILLKDNVNTKGMPTTAGALALAENKDTDDAFIVKQLKAKGALILGKVNLSEWAYYFCTGCPLGYSGVGGQSLNPYGRAEFETGGSSASSGTAIAANYAVAAVGTETSGSITSPSSWNSVVGLKPTIGLMSRTGIVPISSTLDTPGPMTKFVVDNHILMMAMIGKDSEDPKSFSIDTKNAYEAESLKGKRFGALKQYLGDSVYNANIQLLKEAGAEIVELDPEGVNLPYFRTVLDADMKVDLPAYLAKYADKDVSVKNVQDVIDFNLKDSILRAPYGQGIFEGVAKDTTSIARLEEIKRVLMENARKYYSVIDTENLDALLSINNYQSGYSAVAEYPNLTVPMGYRKNGAPTNLTFIGKPKEEIKLMTLGLLFEKLTKHRKLPANYE